MAKMRGQTKKWGGGGVLLLMAMALASPCFGELWNHHHHDIEELEREVFKYQKELGDLVEKKNSTRDQVQVEKMLQRIMDIHGELISLRGTMDGIRNHVKKEHPDKLHILDGYDSRMVAVANGMKRKPGRTPLIRKLDDLLLKVKLKFSSFMESSAKNQKKSEQVTDVEKLITEKEKQGKEREAHIYLRNRSRVKLVK